MILVYLVNLQIYSIYTKEKIFMNSMIFKYILILNLYFDLYFDLMINLFSNPVIIKMILLKFLFEDLHYEKYKL